MVTQCLLVSMGAIETNPNLGTVVGYGSPLQGGCLEGFDFLGLHQITSHSTSGEVTRLST
jgi:hypothetical protein